MDKLACRFGAIGRGSCANRVEHDGHAVGIGCASGKTNRRHDVLIQRTDVKHDGSGHFGNVGDLFMSVGHERRGAQCKQAVGGKRSYDNVGNVVDQRILGTNAFQIGHM